MSGFAGFIEAAAQIGLQNIVIAPQRGLFNITDEKNNQIPNIIAHAVIREQHVDRLETTYHPVEQGSFISDHAFKLPAEIILTLGWSNSPSDNSLLASAVGAAAAVGNDAVRLAAGVLSTGAAVQSLLSGAGIEQVRAAYDNLLDLQHRRCLFTIYTGKRVYYNMMATTIATETDFVTEHSMIATLECREIILVNTQIVSLPMSSQKFPKSTSSVVNKGQKSVVQVQ